MKRLTFTSAFLFALVLPAFSGCAGFSTLGPAHSFAQPLYAQQEHDTQVLTINEVTIYVDVLSRSTMFQYPELFAFDPMWLPGFPKSYVNFYHYYPYANDYAWGFLFGITDESFSLPAFLVTIKNNSSHIIHLEKVYPVLGIDKNMTAPPIPTINALKNLLRELEIAFENRPATSWLEIRRQYPLGVLPLLVDIKHPLLRFFDSRSLVLPGQEYTFLLVFPGNPWAKATLSFFGIPTTFSPAGEVLQRSNFQFEIIKTGSGSTSLQ